MGGPPGVARLYDGARGRRAIAEGAEDLSLSIDEAGAAVAAVPLIGEAMSAPFGGMSDAALGISDAGQATADAVSLLARFLAIALVVVAVVS